MYVRIFERPGIPFFDFDFSGSSDSFLLALLSSSDQSSPFFPLPK